LLAALSVITIPLLPTFWPSTKGALPHAEAPLAKSLEAVVMAPLAATPNTSVPDAFFTNNAETDEGMVVVVVAEVVVVVAAVVVVVVVAPLHSEHSKAPPVPQPMEQQAHPEGGHKRIV